MSNLFLKNNNLTESSFNLSSILNTNNKNINNSTILSATSNNFIGGNNSLTSSTNLSKINSNDINNLLSMLTSENNQETATSELETKLKNMLNQNGGGNSEDENMLNQNGGGYDTENTLELENRLTNMLNNDDEQHGGTFKSLATLGGLAALGTVMNKKITDTESEFNSGNIINPNQPLTNNQINYQPLKNNQFNEIISPKPDLENKIKVAVEVPYDNMSATSTDRQSRLNNVPYSDTSMSNNSVFYKNTNQNPFISSTTTTINKNDTLTSPYTDNLSSTSSNVPYSNIPNRNVDQRLLALIQSKQNTDQNGGDNPALIVFREISAMVSKKLKIPNGPNAKKIAGQLQRDIKEKNENITHDKLFNAAEKHLENNFSKYEKMIN